MCEFTVDESLGSSVVFCVVEMAGIIDSCGVPH